MTARTSSPLGVLAAFALGAGVLVGVLLGARGGRAVEDPPQPGRSPEPTPAAVLAVWDSARADAWAAGDTRRLSRLYTPGSPAGRHDVAMLTRYLDRGLRVEELTMQRLSVDVLSTTAQRLVLRVRDRVTGGAVVGERVRAALPPDRPSVHTLVLRRVEGAWRVASVSPAQRR